jgi:hypothetical protein
MTGPNVVAQTVKISGDTTELNARLAEGIRQLEAFGRSVNTQSEVAVRAFREEAAALKQMTQGSAVSLENMERLTAATRQFESQVESSARRTNVGFESMSRGLLGIAHSGDLAGRGMGTVIAAASNVAFAFGPQGALVGAVAIGGLALYEFFDKSAAKAAKLREAIDKVIESVDPRRIAEVGQSISAEVAEVTTRIQSRTINPLHFRLFDLFKLQDLQVQQGALDTAENRAREQIKLGEQQKTLVDQLSTAREFALKKEGELAKANLAGDAIAGASLLRIVEQARGAVANADIQLRAFLNSSTPFGSIGELLKINVDKELAGLTSEDAKFAMQERDVAGNDNVGRAQKRFDKNMEAVSNAIDKKLLENPFVAAALGVPLTKDAVAKYNQQIAESARLMQLAGFGGPTMLDNLTDRQLQGITATWEGVLKRLPKPKRQLGFGEQFVVPQHIQDEGAGTNYGGEDVTGGGKGLGLGLEDFGKGFDKAIEKFNTLEEAGKAAYNALSRGATNAINQIIETHKLAIGPIKRALGEPIVSFLEALAVRKYAEFVADLFTAPQKAAGDLAGAAAATAGAITVGEIMGTGGGGRGGSGGGGGGGAGSTSDREHRNAGAALGRGRDDGGVTYLDITITQKDMNGREIARLNQQQQRTQDRNQPNRLVL